MSRRRMGRDELLHHITAERLALQQERLALRRLIAAKQRDIDAIEERLSDLDHAEGLLR